MTMQNTIAEEKAAWAVRNEDTCSELVQLMGLTAEDGALLRSLRPAAEAGSSAMVREFYARLTAHANTSEYLEGVEISRIGSMVKTWYEELFSGNYGAEYARKRLLIGQVHVRIGLPVRYPLAMFDVVLRHADPALETAPSPSAARAAFSKVLALDVAIFNQSYEDNQLKHLAEVVGGERLARRLLREPV